MNGDMQVGGTIIKFISRRSGEIDAIRLFANYLVLAIHFMVFLGAPEGYLMNGEWRFWHFFSQNFAPIAMPTLFFVSGYLFYKGSKTYWQRIRRRIGRLLLPYFLWNLIVGLLFVGACLAGLFKATSVEVTNISSAIYWLFPKVVSFSAAPADMPTWYIRTLFVYAVLSPLFLIGLNGRGLSLRLSLSVLLCTIFAGYVEWMGGGGRLCIHIHHIR